MEPKEVLDHTKTASKRAEEVVIAYRILCNEDKKNPENTKHLWSLAYSIVADIYRFASSD